MAEECTHNCDTCGVEGCGSREGGTGAESFRADLNAQSKVKKVYAIVSGKGGVGKSLVTSMLAVRMRQEGKRVGILDADITGPSIPKAFGVSGRIGMSIDGQLMVPAVSSTGIEIMSTNLLLENETDPVIWRGPLIAGVVKQFSTDTLWDNIDYMFVDMPPGTGDVPLTVFQSLPVDGIIIVTSPQELVSMIVEKAVNMAKQMNIPIVGIVENMSYFKCPDCGKEIHVFGESHVDEIAAGQGISVLAKLPIDPLVAKAVDEGLIEYCKIPDFEDAVKAFEA